MTNIVPEERWKYIYPATIIKTVIIWQNEARRLGWYLYMRANIQESFESAYFYQ